MDMDSNSGDFNVILNASVTSSQSITIITSTQGLTTIQMLNCSLMVYDETLLQAQPNIFVDYGTLSATNTNWSAISFTVPWISLTDVNFMIGLAGFGFSSTQNMSFNFTYLTTTFDGSNNFNYMNISYWNYREAVPCDTGYITDNATSDCHEICGDGILFVLPCDDGNTVSGDGCSSTCQNETGFHCLAGNSTSPTICTEICGDGILFNLACDDGNNLSGDGCSSTCTIELGFTCSGGSTQSPSVCIEICGDGILVNLPCDDDNTVSGDGCSSSCQIENGYICDGGSLTTPSVCHPKQYLSIALISTTKDTTQNSVTFNFQISPSTSNL
jgi:cysteine-rich repeat protein